MATVVTKTIGPTGDYSTLAAWFAACPADLVAADTIWRGEVQNTELTGTGTLLTFTGKTVDATHYIELTAAAGASFADHANVRTNALRYNAANGAALRSSVTYAPVIKIEQNYVRISRLQIKGSATGSGAHCAVKAVGYQNVDINQCVIEASSQALSTTENSGVVSLYYPNIRLRNSVIITLATVTDNIIARLENGVESYNCTFVSLGATIDYGVGGDYNTVWLKNCYVGGCTTLRNGSSTYNVTNCATSLTASGWSTVALADAFESVTSGSHDLRLKSGSSLINAGTTDATYAANDISGLTRSGSWDIGAWEYSSGSSGASASFTVTTADATFSGSGEVRPMASFTVTAANATFSGSASSGEASASINATAANATFSGSASGDTSSGAITTPALKNNTGTVLANETGVTVYVYTPDTGALVVKKTGQATNASGVLTVSDALIVAGTLYRIVLVLGSGAEGMDKVTAT